MMGQDLIFKNIRAIIDKNDVVLFMKGTKDTPQCGFSMKVVQILNHLDISFKAVNILEDQELRNALKIFSDWPTFPQLYIKGELIGGCDIICAMFEKGELQTYLEKI